MDNPAVVEILKRCYQRPRNLFRLHLPQTPFLLQHIKKLRSFNQLSNDINIRFGAEGIDELQDVGVVQALTNRNLLMDKLQIHNRKLSLIHILDCYFCA
jgi:hypothetical protein